jgi:hypothetical protein
MGTPVTHKILDILWTTFKIPNELPLRYEIKYLLDIKLTFQIFDELPLRYLMNCRLDIEWNTF